MKEKEELYLKIDNFKCDVEIKYKIINWGNPKGQGKRIGNGMIIGNPDAPKGIKKYPYIDLSEYITEENKEDFKIFYSLTRAYRYVIARKYGLNHKEAGRYAIN